MTDIPNFEAKRSPASAQVAKPTSWRAWRKRLVRRAYESTNSGMRSVKMLWEHAGIPQIHFLTVSARVT
ncbi:hypothetical protein KDH_26810 [Dictyobacter sp. S3.2.2.5]|uniref:Uncharacterized protein n=1 Tax=Dictyobacter halimunensis TaxID=3026934 RepID=A0ABQ6FTT7_9CHLR|nr:hypothetical protein KDH_26810 [Dictyobacter sp. S3.2.2.5]